MTEHPLPGWFNRHHDSVHNRLDHQDEMLRLVLHATERLLKMSGSLSDQLAAAQADTNAKLDAIGTDVSDISADVDTLLAGMTTGGAVTQEMVDAAVGIQNRVTALKESLDAVNSKVPPAAPAP